MWTAWLLTAKSPFNRRFDSINKSMLYPVIIFLEHIAWHSRSTYSRAKLGSCILPTLQAWRDMERTIPDMEGPKCLYHDLLSPGFLMELPKLPRVPFVPFPAWQKPSPGWWGRNPTALDSPCHWSLIGHKRFPICSGVSSHIFVGKPRGALFPYRCTMVYISGWWLTYPSEKYDFVSWDYYSQRMEK